MFSHDCRFVNEKNEMKKKWANKNNVKIAIENAQKESKFLSL